MSLTNLLYVLLIAMVPVVELRGAIPIGIGMGLPYVQTFIVAYIGNLLPIPILILCTRKVFLWLRKKSQKLGGLVDRLEAKAAAKEHLLKKYEMLGLFILVAIPLPGTGAWTGALVSAVFDLRLKYAFPVIALGVLAAGLIVTFVTKGVTMLF